MIQITPQMRVLARLRNTKTVPERGSSSSTAVKLLAYDGQGFWLCLKRLSAGKFRHWPKGTSAQCTLAAHELQVLLFGGDPTKTLAAPIWRPLAHPALSQPARASSPPAPTSISW